MAPSTPDPLRPSARHAWSHWYWTTAWRSRAKAQIQAEPLCRMCMARGQVTAARVADHIVPHRGDSELFWNGDLQSLCKPCHDSAKQQEEKRGHSTEIGADGWPIDPRHPANR